MDGRDRTCFGRSRDILVLPANSRVSPLPVQSNFAYPYDLWTGKAKRAADQSEATIKAQRRDQSSREFTTLKHQPRRARKGPRPPVNTARTKREASVQSARSDGQHAISAIDRSNGELAQDLLLGAVAIARELNWRGPTGEWDVRRVYNIKSRGTLPIHRVRGLGICARRSSLRKFFSALDERAIVPRADSATK